MVLGGMVRHGCSSLGSSVENQGTWSTGDTRILAVGESARYVREFHLLRHSQMRFLAERAAG
jgi:hypothetical protein